MSGVAKTLGEYAADPSPLELSASGRRRDMSASEQDATHRKVIAYFEEAENSTPMQDMRDWAIRDREYRAGSQWTQEELNALRARGQPQITINKIGDKVDLLCGLERKARTDPKAFPNTPQEDDRANAATQALRYIANANDFQQIRSDVYEEMLVEGFGGIDLSLADDGKGGADITISHVPWDRLFYDPHSRRHDFSDARYLGLVIWMDREEIYETYPDAQDVIEDAFLSQSYADTFADRPRDGVGWIDSQRVRVRVVQIQWKESGVWQRCTFTKSGILDYVHESPFKDKKGRSCASLILQSAYVDRENRRFGMVRDLISLQDEINKRRSKALHLLSVNRIITEQGAVEDVDKAKAEMAKPDGAIAVLPGMRFELLPGGDLAQGQFHLLQHATAEMQLAGPNAAMSGTDDRELSGRAILAQQAGGNVQNEPLADALRMWARRVYETCWQAARQYWTGPRWVRVTDDLGATKWVGINRPITVQDKLAEMPDQQRMMAMQQMQLQPGDPRLYQVVGTEGDITDLDVDIVIEEGIDIPSIQQEQFQTLIQLAGMQPGLIPPEVLIAASGLKNKDQLIQMIKDKQQAQAQQQAKMAPIAEAHAKADLDQKQAKAAADMALAQERRAAVVHGIHDVHAGWQEMQAPPDPPSGVGTAIPPEIQEALGLADLRHKHAQADVADAKKNDLLHGAVQRIAQVHLGQQQLQQKREEAAQQADLQRQQLAQQARAAAQQGQQGP
jgi:hypothetical protein